MGLYRAGFDVTGVDIAAQPSYPFKFIRADATKVSLRGFDLIWASPPCQAYTPLNAYNRKKYPDLVAITRRRLIRAKTAYVIENVVQAPLIEPAVLCGSMFGLPVFRHRSIEASKHHGLSPSRITSRIPVVARVTATSPRRSVDS